MMNSLLPQDLIPEDEIVSRIDRLKDQMADAGMDGMFITHRPDYYYFTGTGQDVWAYVSLEEAPLVFVKRYLPRAVWESPLENIVQVRSVTQISDMIKDHHGRLPDAMGLAFDLVPVRDFKFYQSLFSGTAFLDATPLIQACRAIKTPYEIAAMQRAAQVSSQVFEFAAANLAPGERETDFAGRMEAFARTLGHSGQLQMRHYRSVGFSTHITSGASGGMPGALDSPVCGTGPCAAYPFGAGPKVINDNESILIDFGTMVDGYHMDETRMFLLGNPDPRAEAAGRAAIDILQGLQELMAPGVPIEHIFSESVALAQKSAFGDEYLGLSEDKAKFVGHGIGVELVEYPILAKGRSAPLMPGMVFAVEPKFIFKDQFAAGIESVIQITDTGSRFLSVTPNTIFRI